jgi:putative addiction module killer protein
MIEVVTYVDARGRTPFRKWLDELDGATQARVLASLTRIEEGNLSSTKSVGAGVSELRLQFGPGYRIYFGRDGERLVILLCGGTKRRQQADIAVAHLLWQEYKIGKRGA